MLEWRTTNFLQMNQGCCFGLFNQILKPGCTVSKAQLVSLLWEKEKTFWPWEPVNDLTNTYSCTHAHTHTICFETQAHAPTYTLPALHEHTLYISGGKTEIQRPAKKSQRDPVPWGSRGGGGVRMRRGTRGVKDEGKRNIHGGQREWHQTRWKEMERRKLVRGGRIKWGRCGRSDAK